MNLHYHTIVFLHVLAALVWLGGMIAFAILAPVLRDVGDDAARQSLFHRLGTRFRLVGWICIGLLVVTGIGQLHVRGWWGMETLGSAFFWGTPTGRALAWKLGAVAAMFVIQALHDFWLGPRAGAAPAGSEEAGVLRRRAAWLARANALLGLLVVWMAVGLARGG